MTVNETLTAYGTVGLGAVGLVQAWLTRRAISTTQDDVREARKARVDASAPRVTFIATGTSWPPHLVDDHDVTGRPDLDAGRRFVLPRDDNRVIYVSGCFDVVNEGATTAVVSIPVDALVLGGPSDSEPADRHDASQRLRTEQALPLRRGEHLNLWLRTARTAGQWAAVHGRPVSEQEPIVVSVYAQDTLAEGVQDRTDLHVRATPIVPSGRDDHAWVLNPHLPGQPSGAVQMAAAPTVRTYRAEPPPPKPWWRRT